MSDSASGALAFGAFASAAALGSTLKVGCSMAWRMPVNGPKYLMVRASDTRRPRAIASCEEQQGDADRHHTCSSWTETFCAQHAICFGCGGRHSLHAEGTDEARSQSALVLIQTPIVHIAWAPYAWPFLLAMSEYEPLSHSMRRNVCHATRNRREEPDPSISRSCDTHRSVHLLALAPET